MKITPLLDTLKLQKISDDEYFSKKYSNYISNSRLGLIDPNRNGTPERFFNGFSKMYSTSLDIGSAVHELILQPDLFELAPDLQKPTAKLGFVADFLYTLCNGENPSVEEIKKASDEIGWWSGKLTDSRIEEVYTKCTPYWNQRKSFEKDSESTKIPIYLDFKSRLVVNSCVESITNSFSIQKVLNPKGTFEEPISENEQAILLDVKVEIPECAPFILKLKSKLDNYIIDKDNNTITINDVKTIGKILSEFDGPNGNQGKYAYNREIAMYMFLLSLCAKKFYGMDNPICKGNFLVVSTIPKYYSKVVAMTNKDFMEGFTEFKTLLELVAKYVSTDYREFGIWEEA